MDLRYPYTLPPLPYPYDSLVPAIGERTLHFHHDKHLQTYIDNLNKTMESCPVCREKTLSELLTHLKQVPEESRTSIKNNGGGVYNHVLYFNCLSPNGGGLPTGALAKAPPWRYLVPATPGWQLMPQARHVSLKQQTRTVPYPRGYCPCCLSMYGSTLIIWTTKTGAPHM